MTEIGIPTIHRITSLSNFYSIKLIREYYDPMLSWVSGITGDLNGNVYLSSRIQNSIVKYDRYLNPIFTISKNSLDESLIEKPRAVAFFNNKLFVSDFGRNIIHILDTSGDYLDSFSDKSIDLKGIIFFGAIPDVGLVVLNRDTRNLYVLSESMRCVKEYDLNKWTLPSDRMTYITCYQNTIYIGFLNGKIIYLNDKDEFQEYHYNSSGINIVGLSWFFFSSNNIFIIDHLNNFFFKIHKSKYFRYKPNRSILLKGHLLTQERLLLVYGSENPEIPGLFQLVEI